MTSGFADVGYGEGVREVTYEKKPKCEKSRNFGTFVLFPIFDTRFSMAPEGLGHSWTDDNTYGG